MQYGEASFSGSPGRTQGNAGPGSFSAAGMFFVELVLGAVADKTKSTGWPVKGQTPSHRAGH